MRHNEETMLLTDVTRMSLSKSSGEEKHIGVDGIPSHAGINTCVCSYKAGWVHSIQLPKQTASISCSMPTHLVGVRFIVLSASADNI